MFKTIISINTTVHSILKSGISPQYVYAVKAVKMFNGNTKEECITQTKDFLRKQDFTITKEIENVP